MEKHLTIPKEIAPPDANFHEDENLAEASLLEIQMDNVQYIWKAIVNRKDFQAAEVSLDDGRKLVLSPSTIDRIDWQLSYIGSDGIPIMHGDYQENNRYNPREGHDMSELYGDLSDSHARQTTNVTLLLDDNRKGENNMDEKNSLFIADMARHYAVYNRIPIDPESKFFHAYETINGVVDRSEYQQILTNTLLYGDLPKVAILQPRHNNDKSRVQSGNYEIIYVSNELSKKTLDEIYRKLNAPETRPSDYYGTNHFEENVIVYQDSENFTAYYVDGFHKLPEEFLSAETKQKIEMSLDVRKEQGLLERITEFVQEQGVELDITRDRERIADLREINRQYLEQKKDVAIESTEDYTDIDFHKELIDIDKQNLDGTYGQMKNFYRIVTVGENGLETVDNRVFESYEEARVAIARDEFLALVDYDSLVERAITVQIENRESQIQVQAAARSSVPGYVVMSQFEHLGQNTGEHIYLGKLENYDNKGLYNNSDNSLIHVSDNGKMFSFLDVGRGWTQSQQDMIENGVFTTEDYAEYALIKNNILSQFSYVPEKYFNIDINHEGSGVPFSLNWQENEQPYPHGEEERSEPKMPNEQEQAKNDVQEEWKSPKDELSKQLMQGVRNIMESENYKNWLATSASYFTSGYSVRNAILIYFQKPEASYVKGYEAWKEYGRNVAQGTKGAKIFVPVMAYDKTEGQLFRMMMSNLRGQIKQNPEKIAIYRIGISQIEFTMNRNEQIGLRVNGKERTVFPNQQEVKKFIASAILGKIPMYYSAGTVFDVKDTIVPEYLWVKKGYTKDEVVKDSNGKPIKNRKGEVKIINTLERQAKYKPSLEISISKPKDPEKMAILYDVLKTVSMRNGVPVTDVPRESDETLSGGADGYFSRKFTQDKPKGYIVMPNDLEPTRKVTTLLHEMGHSDLHGNLTKLAAQMGENKISRHMREIQAESVAYATAWQFGIETDTSSFKYLAAYTQGFEMQDMEKSLDVIFKECKKLTQEIAAELDARGLNLDLTEKENNPMGIETIETLCKQYTAYALEQSDTISVQMKELPSLAADNRNFPELLDVVTTQKKCMDRQLVAIDTIHADVKALEGAITREEQSAVLERLEASKRNIEGEKTIFTGLVNSFAEISSQSKATIKEKFARDPLAALESMKKDFSKLENLSSIQLAYVAKSNYVKKEYGNLLKNTPNFFVDRVCERAGALDKVVSKNGMFVEVNLCEQWTDKKIVKNGAILHPKVADSIVKQAEVQIRGLKAEAEKTGEYFPYNKCDLTIFFKSEHNLTAYNTRVDIGDGAQTSLSDHLTQLCGKDSELVTAFEKATRERGAKEKILFNEEVSVPKEIEATKGENDRTPEESTRAEWVNAIEQEKAGTTGQEQGASEKDKDEKQH